MTDVLQERSMDQLAQLPESEAIRSYFAGYNMRVLFRLQLLYALVALGAAVVLLFQSLLARLPIPILSLGLVRLIYASRERPFFDRHARAVILGAVMLQPLLVLALVFDQPVTAYAVGFALLATLLLFRLGTGELLLATAVLWSATAGRDLAAARLGDRAVELELLLALTAASALVIAVGALLRRRDLAVFLDRWRREHRRSRERTRMVSELDEARRIQLSMLPRGDPQIPWLELAGISLPASEVGGDYYGYFSPAAHQQAIVIGDVAGHGVASGILLASIRGCLHLLQESPLPPVEILRKLDRMVRQTTGARTFVTLLYALVDVRARTLTFSAAGHPPLLCYRAATATVEEHALYALPLGVGLPRELEQRTVPIHDGDVFVLTTDGLAETLDHRQRYYGDERLHRLLTELAPRRGARAIRDALLTDVWNFKGDAEQTDDITMIVARMRVDGGADPGEEDAGSEDGAIGDPLEQGK